MNRRRRFPTQGLRWLLAGVCALCMTVLFVPAVIYAQETPPPDVLRVYFTDQAQLEHLAATADVWAVDHGAGYAVAPLAPAAARALARAGYVVTIDDAMTSRARAAAAVAGLPRTQSSGIAGFPCYRTVEETYTALQTLAINRPQLAQWIDIGDSWIKTVQRDEGHDLHALVLTNRASTAPKALFLLLAAVHARELTTTELATRFAEHLVREYDRDPDITWLLDHTEIHIVPLGNPDGRKEAERGVLWRKNVATGDGCFAEDPPYRYAGVDLNRNSSFRWNACGSGCSSSQACAETYRGPSPASEPETQALEAYARTLFADQRGPGDADAAPADATGLFISLHSYGELVLFPWGWSNASSPNAAQLQTLGRKFGYYNGYGVCQLSQPGCLYRADGTTDDFVYGELGVAAYTFELGGFFFERCEVFEEEILPDNLRALLYAAKAARRPYKTPAGPDVTAFAVSPMPVSAGEPISVTVTLDDARYSSNGFGQEPVQAVVAGRYSLNAPSWLTETVPFTPMTTPVAGEAVSVTLPLAADRLPVGRHTLWVEGQDAVGVWGAPTALFIDVTQGERAVAAHVPNELFAAPNQRITFTVTVTNTGQIGDAYAVQVTDSDWPVMIPSTLLTLGPGESDEFEASLDVAAAAPAGTQAIVAFRIASAAEPWVQEELTISVDVAERQIFMPIAGR